MAYSRGQDASFGWNLLSGGIRLSLQNLRSSSHSRILLAGFLSKGLDHMITQGSNICPL